MQLTGEQLIAQPIEKVWDGLNDPQVLKACISGCEEIVSISDTEYKVVLLAVVGPVKARFNGKLLLTDIKPLQSYSLAFEGVGGAAGFAKGGAQVRLTASDGGTHLAYVANANIGGKIAQVGSRLIEGVANKISAEFFTRFNAVVSAPDQPQTDPAAPAAGTEAQEGQDPSAQGGRFRAALRRFVGSGSGSS